MENYAVFHYLGIGIIDLDEKDFRIRLLYYHKNCELCKYYKKLNTTVDELEKMGFME